MKFLNRRCRVVNDKSLCNNPIIIVIIDNDYYRDYHDNYCLHKQPTQKKHVIPYQNHSYEEIKAIIDTETNAISESALSVSKSKIATKI